MTSNWDEARLNARAPLVEPTADHIRANTPKLDCDPYMMDRHRLDRIDRKSRSKAANTVVETWVPIDEEVEAIRQGWGTYVPGIPTVNGTSFPGSLYRIRGRTYVIESSGHCFPFDGPGFHLLSKDDYNVLKGIIDAHGHREGIEAVLARYGLSGINPRVKLLFALAEQVGRDSQ